MGYLINYYYRYWLVLSQFVICHLKLIKDIHTIIKVGQMNSKLFAKAFNDIKKQSQTQISKKNKPTLQNQQLSSQVDKKQGDKQPIEVNEQQDQGNNKQGKLLKRISKQQKNAKQENIKKWKNELYGKLEDRKEKERRQRDKSRTIVVQGSSYGQILKVVSKYKIHIEELKDDYIVMDSEGHAGQCYQILRSQGLNARRANEKKQVNEKQANSGTKTVQKVGSIFSRIQ